MTDNVRLFWGMSCPALPAVRTLQDELRGSCAAQAGGIAPVPESNLHVTLRYLGAVNGQDVPAMRDRVQPLVEPCPAFSLVLRGVGRFSRALWVSVDAPPDLYQLARNIDSALMEAGFPGDPKPFLPHVTVARLGRGVSVAASEWEDRHTGRGFGEWLADTVHLYRSDVGPQGSRYTPVASFALRGE